MLFTMRNTNPPPMVASSRFAALRPLPRSAAWCASTAERLDVSSTNVLNAPIHVFVCAAWLPHSGCPMRCMRYDISTPPKITISEPRIHHTARRPVGTPDAERDVASGVDDMVSRGLDGSEKAFTRVVGRKGRLTGLRL